MAQIIEDLEWAKEDIWGERFFDTPAERKGRFNKLSVKAMLADVFLWAGDYARCAEYAAEVIAAKQAEYALQQQQMAQQMALLREQVSTTSERVLKERAVELSAVNSEQLSKILNPLQQNLQLMRTQTEKMQKEHDDSLRELKTAIQINMERERAMGEQTERLAQALTGQNKVQGNFGELKLTQILEQMELGLNSLLHSRLMMIWNLLQIG